MQSFDKLAARLQPHYKRFNVANRCLLSGHSHQAWPDIAFEGQLEAAEAAAEYVDDKWSVAFQKTEMLRTYLRRFYDDPDGQYSFSTSTHDLLVRWLSALDLPSKPRLVTTDSEFHSISRQLTRLEETGIEIVRVPALPLEDFPSRLEKAITGDTAAVLVSHVYFSTSLVNQDLKVIGEAARKHSVPLLIDDYHGTNVVPTSLRKENLEDCYLLIGGYKYLQWGEGNCFLRFPKNCGLRPVITGWFSVFDKLTANQESEKVPYSNNDNRFLGATFEPTSHFRAAKVVDFFEQQKLTPELLHQNYREQVAYLRKHFLDLDLDPKIIRLKHDYPIDHNGGFIALMSSFAGELNKRLKERDIYTDFRDTTLRLGPAPYVTSSQIDYALKVLSESVRNL